MWRIGAIGAIGANMARLGNAESPKPLFDSHQSAGILFLMKSLLIFLCRLRRVLRFKEQIESLEGQLEAIGGNLRRRCQPS